jgi:hypothetical protein
MSNFSGNAAQCRSVPPDRAELLAGCQPLVDPLAVATTGDDDVDYDDGPQPRNSAESQSDADR